MSALPQTLAPSDGRRVRVLADAVVSSYINELARPAEPRRPLRHRDRERAPRAVRGECARRVAAV